MLTLDKINPGYVHIKHLVCDRVLRMGAVDRAVARGKFIDLIGFYLTKIAEIHQEDREGKREAARVAAVARAHRTRQNARDLDGTRLFMLP